jgi:transcriptional antiterminator NusG
MTEHRVDTSEDESVASSSEQPEERGGESTVTAAEPDLGGCDLEQPEAATPATSQDASEPDASTLAEEESPPVEDSEEVATPAPAEAAVDTGEAAVEGEESVEAAADEGEVEGEEEEEPDYFFAPGDWYVVHTYAGYENKVKANLASRIQSMNMEDKIYDVVVPTEEVMELKSGKMQSVQKKVFPGYILVRMELDDDSWYVVRNTPGVTGFVGSGAKPTPLDPGEVTKILAPKTEERPRPKLEFEVGEVVSVIGGAFNGYSGPVSAIEVDKQRVTVLLDLFGRETPVELTFDQVTKL